MNRWQACIFAILIILVSFHAGAVSTSKDVAITICAGSSCGASVTVSNYSPAAGSTVTVTVNPGTYATSPNDQLVWSWGSAGRYNCLYGPPAAATPVQGPGSVSVQIPYAPSEVPQYYKLNYMLQDTSGPNHCGGAATFAAVSDIITVPPTMTAPSITATPPADVTANPPGWPATPGRTLTVCASGCQYTSFSDAVWDAANNSPVDYTKVDVAAGNYVDTCRYGEWNAPAHLWVHGHGGGFAKITESNPNCSPISGNNSNGVAGAQLILDNLDVSEFSAGNVGGIFTGGGCPNMILRNVYLHDGGMGMIIGLGCAGMNTTILNSRFTRLGGGNGPSHNIYINDPTKTNSFTMKRSVFEGTTVGHTFKTHAAMPSTIDCSMIVQAYNTMYYGSEVIDMDEGGGSITVSNSLLAHGPYYFQGGPSNQFSMSYGIDKSGSGLTQTPQYLVLNNDIFLNDLDGSGGPNVNPNGQVGNFVATYSPMTGSSPPPPPYSWTNNKFIGPLGTWQPNGTGTPYLTMPYYFPYCIGSACSCTYSGCQGNSADVDYGTPTTMNTGKTNSKGNLFYSTRATAGIAAISPAPSTYYLWPYDPAKFPMPSVCADPIGNVAVP
jgi:hypothetical protein